MGIEEVYIAGGDGKPMRVQQPDAQTRVALLQEEKLRRELYPSPKTGKRKGGRPKLSKAEAKRRRKLVNDWKRARETGESMRSFCADRGHDLKDVERAVNWMNKQKSREDS